MQSTEIVYAVRHQIYINSQSRWLSIHFGFSNILLSKCYYTHNVQTIENIIRRSWYLWRKKAMLFWVIQASGGKRERESTQNRSSDPRCLTSHCGLTTKHLHFYFRIKSFSFVTDAHKHTHSHTLELAHWH